MKISEKLSQCRVFRGEKEPPMERLTGNRDYLYWTGEWMYVTWPEEKQEEILLCLKNCDLMDCAPEVDNYLLACLFGYYCRYSDRDPMTDATFFKDTIIPEYLQIPRYHFYKNKRADKIWWVEDQDKIGPLLVSFDKVTVLNLWTDYPEKFISEQKELFDKENPYWAEFFSARCKNE